MPVRLDEPAPYAPPATILHLIEAFRERGLSTPFTPDVLSRVGVTESLVPRVMATLQSLDLIDERGNPSDGFVSLREAPQDEYQDALAAVVRGAYAEVFQFADPAADGVERLGDAFRKYKPAGQRRRMVTLFVGLCDAAGLIPDNAPAKPGAKTKRSRRGAYKKGDKNNDKQTASRGPSFSAAKARLRNEAEGLIPAAVTGMMRSLPSDGERMTEAQRDRFLDAFKSVMNYAYHIGLEDAPASSGDGEQPE